MNILRDLRREHISIKSLGTYLNTISSFLMYLKSVDPGTLNLPETIQIDRWVCPLTTEIKNFFTGIDNEIRALTELIIQFRLLTLKY